MSKELPRWELSMYESYTDNRYLNDRDELTATIEDLNILLKNNSLWEKKPLEAIELALPLINRSSDIYENLESYTYCRYSTDTKDQQTMNELNLLEEKTLP